MILTFVGNLKYLSNQELRELAELPYLNGISYNDISIELKKNRIDWKKHQNSK